MAMLGASRETLFSNRMRRRLYGKPGGCTTRKKKTLARRWALEEIDRWLDFHLDPEKYDDIPWQGANLPGPEVRYQISERSGL